MLIVGAGYAGLSAGLALAREGRSVAAFDAMNPGEGASTRNGGITSGSIRPDYATITRRFGEQKAIAIEAEGKSRANSSMTSSNRKGSSAIFSALASSKVHSDMNSMR